jgi:hypothetical protein
MTLKSLLHILKGGVRMKKYLMSVAIVTMFLGGFVSFSGGEQFAARDLPNQHSVPDFQ